MIITARLLSSGAALSVCSRGEFSLTLRLYRTFVQRHIQRTEPVPSFNFYAGILPLIVIPSNSTGGNHLLPQVILVLTDRAIPWLDSLVLAHQNLLGNLVK